MKKARLRRILKNQRKWIALFVVAAYVLMQSPLISAQALSQADLNDILNNSPNWVGTYSEVCAVGSTSTATITGNNVKDAYNFFVSNGYTPAQAAGIVGNLDYESGGVNPTQAEKGGGGGYGIAQFTGAQLTEMRAWVTAQGLDPSSLQGQLEYLLWDLNNSYPTVVKSIKASSTAADATAAFLTGYERPADPAASESQRIADADAILAQYGGSAAVAGTGNGCTTASSTSPNCASAVGDPKILCVAEQYQGIYYSWGGGHNGYAAFRAICSLTFLPTAAKSSTAANPGPCATDCSGLVSVAVDQAFGLNYDWTVAGTMQGAGGGYWQSIPMTSVQPGDILTTPDHVEIVDHYDAGTHTWYTFGSHETGTTTGPASSPGGFYTQAFHWTGVGS